MQIVTRTYDGHLYAVLFSTGLIKVGRGQHPATRIADHRKRLECAGIHVVQSHHQPCSGDAIAAESALIAKCAVAANQKHHCEWFEGLEFDQVIEWLKAEAAFAHPTTAKKVKAPRVADFERYSGPREWEIEKAKRFTMLALTIDTMTAEDGSTVYAALSPADQFIVDDLLSFARDLIEEGVQPVAIYTALLASAVEIVFVQTRFHWRGRPDPAVSDERIIAAVRAWHAGPLASPSTQEA